MSFFNVLNRMSLVLLLLCLVCGGVLGRQLLRPQKLVLNPITPAPEKPLEIPNMQAMALPDLDQFQEIVNRPLFVQGRKPIPEGAVKSADKAKPDVPLPVSKLTAIVITPERKLALFRDELPKAEGEPVKKILRLNQGEETQGWTLKKIRADGVLFAKNEDEQELKLVRKTSDEAKLLAQRAALAKRKAIANKARVSNQQNQPAARQDQPVPPKVGNPQNQRGGQFGRLRRE